MRGLVIYFVNLRPPKESENFYLNDESSMEIITENIL